MFSFVHRYRWEKAKGGKKRSRRQGEELQFLRVSDPGIEGKGKGERDTKVQFASKREKRKNS